MQNGSSQWQQISINLSYIQEKAYYRQYQRISINLSVESDGSSQNRQISINLSCSVSVIGCYRFNLLLLFKFEIKQNVSNTNVATNNIINRFKIISMAESMIWKTSKNGSLWSEQILINLSYSVKCLITNWTNFDKFVVWHQIIHHNNDKFR